MVRQWQELFWDGPLQRRSRWATSPDWVKLRRGLRLDGHALRRQGRARRTRCATALETDGPVLLDVHVSQTENCFPMIPAGAAARDMVG